MAASTCWSLARSDVKVLADSGVADCRNGAALAIIAATGLTQLGQRSADSERRVRRCFAECTDRAVVDKIGARAASIPYLDDGKGPLRAGHGPKVAVLSCNIAALIGSPAGRS